MLKLEIKTDILHPEAPILMIGDRTLHEMKAFRKHQKSFVTTNSFRDYKDLQLITLLSNLEQRLTSRRRKHTRTSNPAPSSSGNLSTPDSSSSPSKLSLPPHRRLPTGIDFHKWLNANDQHELHRRQQQQRIVQSLSGDERSKVDREDLDRQPAYETWRAALVSEQERAEAQTPAEAAGQPPFGA